MLRSWIKKRTLVVERIHNEYFAYPDPTLIVFNKSSVVVDTIRMEEFNATGFVDFANEALNVHSINSAPPPQEEVLFSVCPEAIVAMLISPRMKDDEVIIIRNVRRFVDYKGFSNTFKYAGPFKRNVVFDLLAIDAVTHDHYSEDSVLRDILKAFTAFSGFKGQVIASGKWYLIIVIKGLRCFRRRTSAQVFAADLG